MVNDNIENRVKQLELNFSKIISQHEVLTNKFSNVLKTNNSLVIMLIKVLISINKIKEHSLNTKTKVNELSENIPRILELNNLKKIEFNDHYCFESESWISFL